MSNPLELPEPNDLTPLFTPAVQPTMNDYLALLAQSEERAAALVDLRHKVEVGQRALKLLAHNAERDRDALTLRATNAEELLRMAEQRHAALVRLLVPILREYLSICAVFPALRTEPARTENVTNARALLSALGPEVKPH